MYMANEKNDVRLPGTLEDFGELLGINLGVLVDRLNRGRVACSHARVMAAGNGFARRRPPGTLIHPSKISRIPPGSLA